MAGVDQLITANDYNNIRDKLNLIMGLGATGYGQTLTSSTALSGQPFLLSFWTTLRNDLLKARQHQTGVDESANLTVVTTSDQISEALRLQYDNFCNLIVANQYVCATNQATVETIVNQTRSSAWNAVLTHTVTVIFPSALRSRYFFNAGGQIRFTASRSGTAATSKDTDWTNVLSSMGTIYMNHNSTSFLIGGSGIGSARGFYNLTTSFQQLYTKGSSVYTYNENDYNITAKVDNATNPTTITFKIEFRDDDTGNRPDPSPPAPYGPIEDETVTGTLTSTVNLFRPSGSNVSIIAPTATSTTIA